MAKLFWLQPDNTIVEFPLKAEQNLIGRSSRCDVRIKHPGISAEHALIRVLPGSATVEDLNSTNGTRVNGRRVESHTLRHGDQIGVGRERLMYFAELDEASRFAQPESIEPFAQPAPGGETVNTDTAIAAVGSGNVGPPVPSPASSPAPAAPPVTTLNVTLDLPGAEALIALMAQDKKVIDGRLRFILARGIGGAFVADDVPGDVVKKLLTDALALRK